MEYFGLETICGILQGTDTVSRAFQVRDDNRYISGETKLVEYFCLGSIDATFQTGVVDQTGYISGQKRHLTRCRTSNLNEFFGEVILFYATSLGSRLEFVFKLLVPSPTEQSLPNERVWSA